MDDTHPDPGSPKAVAEPARDAPASVTLAEFLNTPAPLDKATRETIVRQALWMLEAVYVHLPQKRAMYAIDPLQQLRLMLYRLQQTPEAELPSALDFHRDMVRLFASLRDLHTNYLLPPPYGDAVAYVPFMIEECKESAHDDAPAKCIVTKVAPWFVRPPFAPGVEVVDWNGMPIARAIEVQAEAQAGGNPAARHACGLDALTIRPLVRMLPPDEHWVVVGYLAADGSRHELRQDWLVRSDVAATELASYLEGNLALGLDLQTRRVYQTRKLLFASAAAAAERGAGAGPVTAPGSSIESWMPKVFQARILGGPGPAVGYIRIYTFVAPDPEAMVDEFIRLLAQLPRTGLILDVRGNGGGLIQAAEQMLQLLTPRRVEPERFQFINSPFTLALSRRFADLEPWSGSIAQSVETGAPYSLGYPVTSEAACNAIAQRYFGPVVLVTDATCFSATDMFVAGFRDHAIGPILGISANTGAGGANAWRYNELRLLAEQLGDANAVPLPGGVDMRVAVRRSLRVGDHAGVPVEDLGIVPDHRHAMTRSDVLYRNDELLNAAAAILRELPARWLDVKIEKRTPRRLYLRIAATNLSGLDVVVDDRSVYSADVEPGAMAVVVHLPAAAIHRVEIRGLDEHGEIAARYRIPPGEVQRVGSGVTGPDQSAQSAQNASWASTPRT